MREDHQEFVEKMRADHDVEIEGLIANNKKAQNEFNQLMKDLRLRNEADLLDQRTRLNGLLERERADNSQGMEKQILNHNMAMDKTRLDNTNAYEKLRSDTNSAYE